MNANKKNYLNTISETIALEEQSSVLLQLLVSIKTKQNLTSHTAFQLHTIFLTTNSSNLSILIYISYQLEKMVT